MLLLWDLSFVLFVSFVVMYVFVLFVVKFVT